MENIPLQYKYSVFMYIIPVSSILTNKMSKLALFKTLHLPLKKLPLPRNQKNCQSQFLLLPKKVTKKCQNSLKLP